MVKEIQKDLFSENKKKRTHAMESRLASSKKVGGHKNEEDFNFLFGDKKAKINYSGPSSDCFIEDLVFFDVLVKKLEVLNKNVSLKSGNTIQIHLGWFPELTLRDFWLCNLSKVKVKNKLCTTSQHGKKFEEEQIVVLKDSSFWRRYLAKGDILCYRESKKKWVFFNMEHVIDFIIKNFDWRLLPTGRIKGDFEGKQYLTYEYRAENHKKCFVLGAHGGKKGKEFIELLLKKIPFVRELR